jgi:hypothetical protein
MQTRVEIPVVPPVDVTVFPSDADFEDFQAQDDCPWQPSGRQAFDLYSLL